MPEEKDESFVSWRWLTPVLLSVLIGIGSWFATSVLADVRQLKQDQVAQKAVVDLRVQALEYQILGVREAQKRQMDLLKKIAARMGIEAAE